MKIGVVVAAYETGTTGEYVKRALQRMQHDVTLLSQWGFYDAIQKRDYDLYFAVDSGGPLNLFSSEVTAHKTQLKKMCFWMIDYRRGKTIKNPNDLDTCKLISDNGGWIFQAQFEDVVDCLNSGIDRVSWLRLAADVDVWKPGTDGKIYDVGFIGNVWDGVRQKVLDDIRRSGLRLGFPGHGAALMEVGAQLLSTSRVGFNMSSFFGEPIAFDVNMRVFETLACGVPLVTNVVPSLFRIFGGALPAFIKTYSRADEIVPLLQQCLADEAFLNSGLAAREWVALYGTYDLAMKMAMVTLQVKGVFSE